MWNTVAELEFSSDENYFYIRPTMVENDTLEYFYSVVRRCPMEDYEWFFDTCKDSCPEDTLYDSDRERCNWILCEFPGDLCTQTVGTCFKEGTNQVIYPYDDTCIWDIYDDCCEDPSVCLYFTEFEWGRFDS